MIEKPKNIAKLQNKNNDHFHLTPDITVGNLKLRKFFFIQCRKL